jgi:transposase-like protein
VKTHERELARRLRREEGASINEIAKRIEAAQSSISRWVRDIDLTEDQREALRIAAYNGHVKGRTMNSQLRRDARRMAQEEGRALAASGDQRFASGCMLYWAEGDKARNQVRFTNSDPEMVGFFVAFLRTYWNLEEAEIRISCNLFADHVERQREIEQFWLDVAGLPQACLCKSTVNVCSKYSKKKRQNKLPYGTCRLVVHRTRIVQSIYGGIQEIGGFRRDAWLE